MNKNELINKVTNLFSEKEIIPFCGAGLSINSGIPLVGAYYPDGYRSNGIVTHILDYILSSSKFSNKLKSNFSKIPFESFMEKLAQNGFNLNNISNIFDADPNFAHILFAKLYKEKYISKLATMNFDVCFEKAIKKENVKDVDVYYSNFKSKNFKKPFLIKPHGSFDDVESMSIIMENIVKNKNFKERKTAFKTIFSNNKTVLILGYSASDTIDLKEILKTIKPENRANILFIKHGKNENENIEILKEKNLENIEIAKIFSMFSNYNMKVYEINTDELINEVNKKIFDTSLPITKPKTIKWENLLKKEIKRAFPENSNKLKYLRANLLSLIGQYDLALDEYNEISEKNDLVKIKINETKLTILKQSKSNNKTVILDEISNELIKILRHSKNNNIIALSNAILSDIFRTRSKSKKDTKKAISYSKNSITTYSEMGIVSSSEIALLYNNLVLLYRQKGKFKKAKKYAEKSYDIHSNLGNLDGKISSLSNLGLIHGNLENFKKSITILKKALQFAKELNSPKLIADIYFNLALVKRASGDEFEQVYQEQSLNLTTNIVKKKYLKTPYKKAKKYALKSERLYTSLDPVSEKGLSRVYNVLGLSEYFLANTDDAEKYYIKAISLCKKLNNFKGLANANNNYGILLCYKSKMQKERSENKKHKNKGINLMKKAYDYYLQTNSFDSDIILKKIKKCLRK